MTHTKEVTIVTEEVSVWVSDHTNKTMEPTILLLNLDFDIYITLITIGRRKPPTARLTLGKFVVSLYVICSKKKINPKRQTGND